MGTDTQSTTGTRSFAAQLGAAAYAAQVKEAGGWGDAARAVGGSLGTALGRGLSGASRYAVKPVLGAIRHVATRPVLGGPNRAFSPGRTLVAGGLGAGATGYGLHRYAAGESSPETDYAAAQEEYRNLLRGQQQRLSAARTWEADPHYGNWNHRLARAFGLGGPSAKAIHDQMLTGNYGGGFFSPDAAGYAARAQRAASRLQHDYQQKALPEYRRPLDPASYRVQAQQLHGQLASAVFPEQRAMLESELRQLQERALSPSGPVESPEARQLRFRMLSLGLPDPAGPGGFTPLPSGQEPAGYGWPGEAGPTLDDQIRQYALSS
jgi:hypothetical protein